MIRPAALLSALALAACAPAPEPTPLAFMSPAEAAAVARCDAQAIAAGAPVRNQWDAQTVAAAVRSRCLEAWRLERVAVAQATPPRGLRTREEAARECRGARDESACVAFLMQPPVR